MALAIASLSAAPLSCASTALFSAMRAGQCPVGTAALCLITVIRSPQRFHS